MLQNELTFENHEDGMMVAAALLRANYVVLLSTEENLLVLDYEWSERGWESGGANRNDVVFMRRDEFDEKYYEIIKEED